MEARHPETPGRLRVVDLGIDSERQLHLGGGFACVLTLPDARREAARWIATTIVEPQPADSGVEIDIERAVLGGDVLRTFWRDYCARRREAMDATHAAYRSEQQRIHAALESLRAFQAPPLPSAGQGDPEAELTAFKSASQTYMRVQSLLTALDAFQPEPSPEALALADEWDANVALLQQPEGLGEHTVVDVEAAQQHVRPAPAEEERPDPTEEERPAPKAEERFAPQAEEAPASAPVGEEARADLERLHGAVVEAQSKVFGARRGRRRLVARYNKAVAAERAALAAAGVDSYAAFLLGLKESESPPSDDRVRLAPDEETAAAIDELDAATRARQVAHRDDLKARARALRSRARALLGREPGDDLAGELRAQRVDPPARTDQMHELEEVLRGAGVEIVGDVVTHARVFVASPPSVHIPQPPTWPMLVARPVVPLLEVEALEKQSVAQEQLLEELEVEMMRLDVKRDAELAGLTPDDFVRAVDTLLDAYRAGDVLEGRLPMVLDGVLDGIAAEVCNAAVVAFAGADDVQVIVVTDDPEVTNRVSDAGGTIVRWPEP